MRDSGGPYWRSEEGCIETVPYRTLEVGFGVTGQGRSAGRSEPPRLDPKP